MTNIHQIHMSPRDIQQETRKLEVIIGPRAEVFCSYSTAGKPCSIGVYANGMTKGHTFRIDADDWREAFALAHEKWDECGERVEAEKVQKMALAVIAIVHAKGACAMADLRGADFTQGDIDHYGTRACELANTMAANGPFSITAGEKANAA